MIAPTFTTWHVLNYPSAWKVSSANYFVMTEFSEVLSPNRYHLATLLEHGDGLDLYELPLDGEHGHSQQRARCPSYTRFLHRIPHGPQIGTLTCNHVDSDLY